MDHAAQVTDKPSRERREPYRVERRFTPGRRDIEMVKGLLQAHNTQETG